MKTKVPLSKFSTQITEEYLKTQPENQFIKDEIIERYSEKIRDSGAIYKFKKI